MEYNDFACPTPDEYEVLAKAYTNALKQKGFIFVRLDSEGVNVLVDEVFDLLFKLRSTYSALGSFLGANNFYRLNEEQIDIMRTMFDYKHNRSFKMNWNKTKCFVNSISLENRLIMKMLLLAQKSDEYEKLLGLCFQRMRMSTDLYEVAEIMQLKIM